MIHHSVIMAKSILQNHDSKQRPTSATNLVWLPISTPWKNLNKICNMHIFTCQKLDANQDLRRKKIKDLLAYAEEHCRAAKPIDFCKAAFNT